MNYPRINIIAAIGKKRELGKDNALLWNIPEDMHHFREMTTGCAVIMGQKTYESIGRPLPHRTNIVLTLDPTFQPSGCVVVGSLDEALATARETEKENVFIIGGGSVYKQFIGLADRLYLTLVEGEFDADVFFPEYETIFQKVISRKSGDNGIYRYEFVVLEK
ncbi:MAG: dihydrofolate reductase [Candidatus Moranbacteria bacterium]|nr:dihydrofolate reductase [Candidatus Moranbacteria bacterium]